MANDLDDSLGPLVALPEVILAELDKPDSGAGPRRCALIWRASGASLRASQTIKDMLTLGRQGQVSGALDLVAVVSRCVAENSASIASDAAGG